MANSLANKQRRRILLIAVLGLLSHMLPMATNLSRWPLTFRKEDFDLYGMGASVSFLIIIIIILRGNTSRSITRKHCIIVSIAAITSLLLVFFKMIQVNTNLSTAFAIICDLGSLLTSATILLFIRQSRKPDISLRQSIKHIKKQISIPITHTRRKSSRHISRSGRLLKLNGLNILRDNGTITEDEYQLFKTLLS